MIKPSAIVKTKRKTLSLCVNRLGAIIVRAPLTASDEKIWAFVREKQPWLEKQMRKMEQAGVRLPLQDLDGYEFLLLGENYTVKHYEGDFIRLDKEKKLLFVPEKKTKARITAWLKENARRILTLQTERYAAEMGLRFQSVEISSAKTRWGTCSSEGKIRYTYRLLFAPREVIDYVVVHELAHLIHMNHGKAFWGVVERYIPDYKRRRKWLKDRGALMEIF